MIASGSSERGLSDVTIATSASSRCDPPHQRPLAAIAVAAGAEDDDHTPVAEVARRAQHRRERVGRVRVVDDDRERLPLVDRLEAPGDARHGRDAFRDRVLVDVEQQPGRDRAEHVLDVEETAQRRLDVDPAGSERLPGGAELELLGPDLRVVAEPEGHERRAMRVARARRRAAAPTRRRRSPPRAAAAGP